jgi:hypothetical protein
MPAKERDGLPVYQNPQCYLQEIDATTVGLKTSELLAIPRREPLLRIRQVIYSTKGNPIMYVLGFYRADRHNLVIRLFRQTRILSFPALRIRENSMAGDPGKQ